MKVFINKQPVQGPTGGGSKILFAIISALQAAGHSVTFDIRDPNATIQFIADPRLPYRSDLRSVMRIGDVGSHGKPELKGLIAQASHVCAAAAFTSRWALQECAPQMTFSDRCDFNHVIHNAPLDAFFIGRQPRMDIPEKHIRFVTHHWSDNPKKGGAFYRTFNEWCKARGHSFLLIGRTDQPIQSADHPDGIPTKGPFDVSECIQELQKHDVYITASEHEAGANHIMEASAVGLPVLFNAAGGSMMETHGPKTNLGIPMVCANEKTKEQQFALIDVAIKHLHLNKLNVLLAVAMMKPSMAQMQAQWVTLLESVAGFRANKNFKEMM